ncbi:MAG: hypothetical protein KJ006_00050 [Thermoleophilia bacterium]|nr:hypothetical protein [Thermoleophilia bacterium]
MSFAATSSSSAWPIPFRLLRYEAAGFRADAEFNATHGAERLYFEGEDIHVDVFLDEIKGCHTLELKDRLALFPDAISPADLLLSKLQIVETTEKDRLDIVVLLVDCPLTEGEDGVSIPRITAICARDRGWYRTVTEVAAATATFADGLASSHADAGIAADRLRELIETIERAPKSRRWKLRARIGDRAPRHDNPEDAHR